MKPVLILSYNEMLLPANKAHRETFCCPTLKEFKSLQKDFRYMDPDYLRSPKGGLLPFMECDGVVYTESKANQAETEVLQAFFDDSRDADFNIPGTRWEDFGGTPTEIAAPYPHYRVAYRGGKGYGYGISEYRPGSPDNE